ncbi:unnamed protein product [Prunus brigantina]
MKLSLGLGGLGAEIFVIFQASARLILKKAGLLELRIAVRACSSITRCHELGLFGLGWRRYACGKGK